MKALELTGQKVCGATVLRRDGRIYANSLAWLVQCGCGRTFRRGSGELNQAIKGHPKYTCLMRCKECTHSGFSKSPAYQYWFRNKCYFCDRWQDLMTFQEECYSKRTARFLCRRDVTKSFSPENFYWSPHMESYNETLRKCVEIFKSQGMSESAAKKRASGITRQRRQQIIAENSFSAANEVSNNISRSHVE